MRSAEGSIGDCLAACICMLLMTLLLLAYIDNVGVMDEKEKVNQIARKYILRMESVGSLNATDKLQLCEDLENAGVTDICLDGTTQQEVPYGATLELCIRGKLRGRHEFYEKRVTTAKH